ncbi:DUF2306 domain-containing protein [Terracoccus sp. 273MFTsu3.1]|uniref:DUF2306 domain-containing protein n=1 Tax=Terracoccus sp. 273MFTsu3.1 TaxID=1172188 RepID=UPI000380FD82|nr:DUF2306 domain-containing protein [Terracoccus sp. 273MFTsu3.1]
MTDDVVDRRRIARRRSGRRGRSAGWGGPVAMIALSAVPLAAGALRLAQIGGVAQVVPADRRFADAPAPLVLHIVGAAVYAVIGALQLVPALRRRHPVWHRRAGRVVTGVGVLVAGSALWMTLLYAAKPGTGDLLYVLRLAFGSAMVACLVLGITAIRRGDVPHHRAWMIRAYAIALAAGTQMFTEGIGGALFGTGGLKGDLAKAAGWVINLAVAEWVIRRSAPAPTARPGRNPSVAATGLSS